jgi:hypothetical protein
MKNTASLQVAAQTTNNSTGWAGQVPGSKEHLSVGQTFIATADGDLQTIKLFPNMIGADSHLQVSIHQFDQEIQHWGSLLGTANASLQRKDAGKWFSIDLPGPHLQKGHTYGFRLDSKDSYIGLGEACCSANEPVLKAGKEWHFSNSFPQGYSFTYLSLAFKVEVC